MLDVGYPVYALAFDPTGEYLLVGGKSKDIKLFRHASSKLVTDYSAHGWEVLDISVSPDGRLFCSGGGDRTAVLWDVPSGRVLRRLTGHLSRVNAVSCCPESTDLILTGSYDRTVRIWDKRTFSRFPSQVLNDAEDSVESVDVRLPYIVVASADGFVRIYDARKGQVHFDAVGFPDIVKNSKEYCPVMRVRIGMDGAYYAAVDINGNVKLVDLEGGEILKSYESPINGGNDLRINGLTFDKNEERLFYGAADGCLYSWEIVTEEMKKHKQGDSPILSVAFSGKKNMFASGTLKGGIIIQNFN